jgi:MFS family permease
MPQMPIGYFTFLRENLRFLAFGFVLTLSSSFGQTYYIALFSADIRGDFGLSHGDFGLLYSLATLASGLSLVWVGRQIDRVDLRLYTALVCAGLVASCWFMALVPSVTALVLALFVLRLTGQGLMGHTAITSMARYFDAGRGRAIGIASIGHAVGEAVFPLTAVGLIAALGWRQSWGVVGLALAVVLALLVPWLLKGHGSRHGEHLERAARANGTAAARRQWSRREMVRDVRFYMVLPAVLAAPFILTGLFFHQVHLADSKGWELAWYAACFVAFSAAAVVAGLLSGPLVDRFGAAPILPASLVPLALGLLTLVAFDHEAAAALYLTLTGLAAGASFTVPSAMWAEVYGVAHLGAIRALVSAIVVVSTAVSPAAMGGLIDLGVSMEAIAVIAVVYVGAAAALAGAAFRVPAAGPSRAA